MSFRSHLVAAALFLLLFARTLPAENRTIDGTFNLEVVARLVLWELRDRLEVRS